MSSAWKKRGLPIIAVAALVVLGGGVVGTHAARMAVGLGADGIIVSNHGGRQLDGTSSSISMLPRVSDAISGDTDVLFDGGIRTGADIMRALALGAKACLIGRSYIYGLGAGGQAGVAKAIDILEKELSVTMALTGINRIADIDGRVLEGNELVVESNWLREATLRLRRLSATAPIALLEQAAIAGALVKPD